LNIETKDDRKYYELDNTSDSGVEPLSNKMERMKVPNVMMYRSDAQSGSTTEAYSSKCATAGTFNSVGSNIEKVNLYLESPGSKQNFSQMECNEFFKAKKVQRLNESPTRSPSKINPFDYSFADSSNRSDKSKDNDSSTLGKKTYSVDNGVIINTLRTQADSTIRKDSCFSCSDSPHDSSLLIPHQNKINRNNIKTNSKQSP
jgi:hypothetical protein